MGPGAYDAKFKLVEKRDDIGVVKMPDLNEFNAREYIVDPVKDVERFDNEDLDPNLNAIKPNIKTFKYHENVEVGPENPPDALIFPE